MIPEPLCCLIRENPAVQVVTGARERDERVRQRLFEFGIVNINEYRIEPSPHSCTQGVFSVNPTTGCKQ